MYERILVTLDGSNFAEEIIGYAAGLAAAQRSTLTFLRVVDKPDDAAEAEAYVQRLASAHNASSACAVASGDVADAILTQAQQVPGTLVAMSTHGRSGLMQAMLGSVALRVIRASAGAPVLVYRPAGDAPVGPQPVPVRSVVLPVDGSELSESMMEPAGELARRIGARLEVVAAINLHGHAQRSAAVSDDMHVMESGYVRTLARELGARHQVPADWETLHGDPVEAISAYLAGRRDVILAMATHGRSALKTMVLGSVTAGCLGRARVPVLVRMPQMTQ